MCGINGLISKKNIGEKNMSDILAKMNNLIIHRGPDEDGFMIANNEWQ